MVLSKFGQCIKLRCQGGIKVKVFWMGSLRAELTCHINGVEHILENPWEGKQRLQVTACVSKCHCKVLCASSSSKSCPLQQLSNAKQSLPRHFSVDKCAHYPTSYISRIIHTLTASSWSCIWAENDSFARNWLHNGAEGQRMGPKAQKQSVVFAWKAFYTAFIIHSRRTWLSPA